MVESKKANKPPKEPKSKPAAKPAPKNKTPKGSGGTEGTEQEPAGKTSKSKKK